MKKKNNCELVTFIVPTYNVEKYVRRCIDSLIGQTYREIEIIAVDDGSNDNTIEVIERYVKVDRRVKLIRQDHGGPNHARKEGVKNARGKYVMFVDSDDYIERNTVKLLIDKIHDSNIDTIRFNAKRQNGEIVFPILQPGEKDRILKRPEIMELLLTTYKLNSLCFQIYRTDALRRAKSFNFDLDYGEDFLINLEVCQETDKILVISDVLYCYCDNSYSTTRNKSSRQVMKNIADRIVASRKAIEIANTQKGSLADKAAYNQIKMVKSSIMDIAKTDMYDKNKIVYELSKVLTVDSFSLVDRRGLSKYIRTIGLMERIKNRKIIEAIINADYEYIWNYMYFYRIKLRLTR